MYDVVEIATGIVISEWHTEKEAQEQVDRFNEHANRNYFEVREHQKDNTIVCSDLNEDGTCKYAKKEFNKVLHCKDVECSRRWANEYKQKYENLLDKVKQITISQRFLKSELNHPNIDIRQVVERELYFRLMSELKRHYIEFKELDEDDSIRLVVSIKAIKNENQN